MLRTSLAPILTLAVLLLSLPATAQVGPRPSWYLDVELGESKLSRTEPDAYRLDGRDDSFTLRGGYQINDNVHVVGSYTDLGRFPTDFLGQDQNGDTIVTETRDVAASALSVQLELGWTFLDRIRPSIGLGVANWRLDIPDGDQDRTQDTAPLFRAGIGFNVADDMVLRVGVRQIGRIDARTRSLSLRLDF
jgi:opacity protein-like surface antigen